jgi:hypothetical protein
LALLAGALVGGCCGAAFDPLTATISPEYFLIGKDLSDYNGPFRVGVAETGFRGGLPLGALVVGIGLVRSQRDRDFSWGVWLAAIASCMPVMLALGAAVMLVLDPFDVREASAGVLSEEAATSYLLCWGAHFGAYLGVGACVCRDRPTLPFSSSRIGSCTPKSPTNAKMLQQ